MYKRSLAIVISLAIFFLAGELIVRLHLFHKIIYDIEMARYAAILKIDSPNPLISHLHRPNVDARLMNAAVHINSDGFRDDEYPLKKGDKYRIIFLGDSLTFGWGVEREDTFENILEIGLNKKYATEIINFGTGNYNTEQEANLFLEKGLKYDPDKVVLFYFINDAEVTPKKSTLWFLANSRIITFYWSRIHALINNLIPSRSFKEYYANLYMDGREGWERAKRAFLKLKDICRSNDIALQVVLLPELHELREYPFRKEHVTVSGFLRKSGIDYLDLLTFFEKHENPMQLWVAPDDAHPNKLGHELIARYTLDFIAKRKEPK